jgi:hypothetical protein
MHALIAFALGPVGRWVAGAVFIVALAASIYAKGRIDGRDAMQAKYEAMNAAAAAGAKKEADRVQGGDRSKVKGFDRD